jgi:hypothetical protein
MAFTQRRAHGAEVGAILGLVDVAIFDHFMGVSIGDLLSSPMNDNAERAEREALYTCLVLNMGVSILMRSLEVFIVSGAVLIGVDFMSKHANAVNPSTGRMTQGQQVSGSLGPADQPMPNYEGAGDVGSTYAYGS